MFFRSLNGQLARAAGPPPLRNDSDPYWSGDGRYVAFDLAGTTAGYVAAGHGSVTTMEKGLVRGFRPAATELLVESDGATDVLTLDGRIAERLNGTSAAWSPDGGRIAYLRDGALYASDATGAHEQRLAGVPRPADDSAGPVWSPDGREIAIATGAGLAIVPTDGSPLRLAGPRDSVNPSWSPDGRTLAFERNDGVRWLVWLVDASGQNAHAITAPGYDSRFPPGNDTAVVDRLDVVRNCEHVLRK